MTARNASNNTSTAPPSLTTSTSVTDASSELMDENLTSDEQVDGSDLADMGALNAKDKSLTLEEGCSPQKDGAEYGSRTVSGKTLVGEEAIHQEELVADRILAVAGEWELGSMTGDDLKLSAQQDSIVKKKNNKRLGILDKMSKRTRNVLGKRGHEAINDGMEKIQARTAPKSSNRRVHQTPAPSSERLAKKRPRYAESKVKEAETTPPAAIRQKPVAKRKKQWLSEGLYVGQDQDSVDRLRGSRNHPRKTEGKKELEPRKANSIMPLPMLAGQRILDLDVFVGEAANMWKRPPPFEHSTCLCSPDIGCGYGCLNRSMFYECDDTNCNVGAELCSNRPFAELKHRYKAGGHYNIGIELIKTIDRGYGIRANRTFEPNQVIVEYTGEVITQEECDKRMHTRYKDAESYYLMDFDQSMILDATRGSIARFVNHSCEPNCRMIKWTVRGNPRMALFAGDEGIMTGEELTYDYNFTPYSVKNVQECRCGADVCRGVLGPKPKEVREALKPIAGLGKRKFQPMVEGLVEGILDAVGVKRRKINAPKRVRDALANVKPMKEKTKPKVKPLPKGWVYPEEAPEFKKVNDVDPEAILRERRRKTSKGADAEIATPTRRTTISGAIFSRKMASRSTSRRQSLTIMDGKGVSEMKRGEEDEEEQQHQQPPNERRRRDSVRAKASKVRKEVVGAFGKGGRDN
ncbi:MAG: hypothetical protein Q9163_002192 [Psora crenata]